MSGGLFGRPAAGGARLWGGPCCGGGPAAGGRTAYPSVPQFAISGALG